MTPEIARRFEILEVTPEEAQAVEEAVRRTRAIWQWVTATAVVYHESKKSLHLKSPTGMPTAEQAIGALGCGWKRQAQLWDLVLDITAHYEGGKIGPRGVRKEAA